MAEWICLTIRIKELIIFLFLSNKFMIVKYNRNSIKKKEKKERSVNGSDSKRKKKKKKNNKSF